MGANNWWLPQRKPQVTRGAHVIRSPCMTSDDTNHYDAQPWNPPQCLFQIGEAISPLSVQNFNFCISIQTQHTKGNLKNWLLLLLSGTQNICRFPHQSYPLLPWKPCNQACIEISLECCSSLYFYSCCIFRIHLQVDEQTISDTFSILYV